MKDTKEIQTMEKLLLTWSRVSAGGKEWGGSNIICETFPKTRNTTVGVVRVSLCLGGNVLQYQ